MQLAQVEERQRDARDVDEDPEDVEDVMPERAVHEGTSRRVVSRAGARRERAAQKSGAQIDGQAREPDHKSAEQEALERQYGPLAPRTRGEREKIFSADFCPGTRTRHPRERSRSAAPLLEKFFSPYLFRGSCLPEAAPFSFFRADQYTLLTETVSIENR